MNSETDKPSANGNNGRDAATGRFQPGNRFGRGNPYVARVAAWRRAFAQSVTPADITRVLGKLKEAAFAGESWAIKELLERALGRPPAFSEPELVERFERLEAQVLQTIENRRGFL